MKKTTLQTTARPKFFGQRRAGPERKLEDIVVAHLASVMPAAEPPTCIFGSRPIGAGAPDLVLLYRRPNLSIPAKGHRAIADLLAYLRVVRLANPKTLQEKLQISESLFNQALSQLVRIGAVVQSNRGIALTSAYRDPLDEVVAIEAKISKWFDAISQATRNRTFSHRSFVALPEPQARLAIKDPRVAMFGIGVISVMDDRIKLVRRSRRSAPRVWRYYFDLFLASARHPGNRHAIRGASSRSGKTITSVQVR